MSLVWCLLGAVCGESHGIDSKHREFVTDEELDAWDEELTDYQYYSSEY